MENYNDFLTELMKSLGCDKRTARRILETTISKYLASRTFKGRLSADCADTNNERITAKLEAFRAGQGGFDGCESRQ